MQHNSDEARRVIALCEAAIGHEMGTGENLEIGALLQGADMIQVIGGLLGVVRNLADQMPEVVTDYLAAYRQMTIEDDAGD